MSRRGVLHALAAAALCAAASPGVAYEGAPGAGDGGARMSASGEIAAAVRRSVEQAKGVLDGALVREVCVNSERCIKFGEAAGGDEPTGPRGGQAELSIAVDETGKNVVVGYNDTRGFSLPAISVSGVMYSSDGGKTFVDGGQLPTPGDVTLGGVRFPQVFGDPEVKHLGGCNFAYASIMLTVKELVAGVPTPVQTLSVHRSRDCGRTWEGPFEVTGATNPNGFVFSDGSAVDAADKEFMDYDRRTGRALISWTNFTHPAIAPGAVQISTTYSDDLLTGSPPTWSDFSVVSATEADGQASIPRFAHDGTAYVAWRRFPFPGTFQGYGNTTAFARSTDGGATWGAPIETSAEFFTMDHVLGNDRVNTSPSLAVGPPRKGKPGNVYLVYVSDDLADGADVVFQRSTDGGLTFEPGLRLNDRPGGDRAQWFPWVTVDEASGRVYVFYYDQGVAPSGDLTQVTYTFSDDGGRRWAAPAALSERPFHAGWGNDTGQPNLGDYNQAVVRRGKLYAAFAVTSRPPGGFQDGQPDLQLTVPDAVVRVLPNETQRFGAAPLKLAGVDAYDLALPGGHDGYVDAGESVGLKFTVRNATENPLSARELAGLLGTLASPTPGVKVAVPISAWRSLSPGEAGANRFPFVIFTSRDFVPGTPIELVLTLRAAELAPAVLRHTLFTGVPVETPLFSADFEAGATGWAAAHGGGANVVPWVLAAGTAEAPTFCGQTSNVMFHQNASDGPAGGSPTRWERLIGPTITVPADSEYVTVELDVCYDTEEDQNFGVLAYDGFFLRVTDVTPGRTLRSVLVEAFQDDFTTGELLHYPKHLPRSSNRAYFEDMSAWAGPSGGVQRVRLRLPGMAGSQFQLRFEYTQDASVTCADLRPGSVCGVSVDNVVVKSVASRR